MIVSKFLRLLLTAAAALVVFAAAQPAFAGGPEIGRKVTIKLHDGNQIQGTLVNKSDAGYVVQLGGTQITVAYKDVASITGGAAPQAAPTPTPVAPTVAPSGGVIIVPQGATGGPTIVTNNRPPAPRVRGTGLMVAGWVMFGIAAVAGGTLAYYCSQDSYDYFDERTVSNCSEDIVPIIAAVPSVVGVAGLAMGISGTVLRAVSKRQYEDWEAKYANEASLAPRIVSITPIVRPDHGGLAIVGRF